MYWVLEEVGVESGETLGCYEVGLVDQWGAAGVDGAEDVAPAEASGFPVHTSQNSKATYTQAPGTTNWYGQLSSKKILGVKILTKCPGHPGTGTGICCGGGGIPCCCCCCPGCAWLRRGLDNPAGI